MIQLLLNVAAMAFWLVVPPHLDARYADDTLDFRFACEEPQTTINSVEQIPVSIESLSLLANDKVDRRIFDTPALDGSRIDKRSGLSDKRDLRYYIRWDHSKNTFIFDEQFFTRPFVGICIQLAMNDGLADPSDARAAAEPAIVAGKYCYCEQFRYSMQWDDSENQFAFDGRPISATQELFTFQMGLGSR